MKQEQRVVFIGAGSMAEALLAGLLQQKLIPPHQICVTNRSDHQRLDELRRKYGVETSRQLEEMLSSARIVILAMKPKDTAQAVKLLAPHIQGKHLVISLVAGVTTTQLEDLLQRHVAVVRAMPNTSSAVKESATTMVANDYATPEDKSLCEQIFQAVGSVQWMEEGKMDAATALAGCGPAYVYYLVEAMQRGAHLLGLAPDEVRSLAVQTLVGAAEMLQQDEGEPQELRRRITSPGGATEAGIRALDECRFSEAVVAAMQAAAKRSRELGEELQRAQL